MKKGNSLEDNMSEVTFIKKVTPAKDNQSGTVKPSSLPPLEAKDHSPLTQVLKLLPRTL